MQKSPEPIGQQRTRHNRRRGLSQFSVPLLILLPNSISPILSINNDLKHEPLRPLVLKLFKVEATP